MIAPILELPMEPKTDTDKYFGQKLKPEFLIPHKLDCLCLEPGERVTITPGDIRVAT